MNVIENNLNLPKEGFKITASPSISEDLIGFYLLNETDIIGQILVRRGKKVKDRGVLDIFVIPEYRSRWLTYNFAQQIFESVTTTLKRNQINIIVSKALHKHSPRLLDFFGFQRYNNNKCYYLKI